MAKNQLKKDLRSRAEKKTAVMHDGVERTTVSFYKYVRITDPKQLRDALFAKLTELGCLGRIYVASEGINAQMNVPKASWDQFDAYLQHMPEFNGVPYKIAAEETDTVSFYKLTIKVRTKIVADGLDDDSFDVTNTGEYLTAKEMNEYIDDSDAVIVDMRNGYESEIGHFEGAITPDVDTFREELKKTPDMLKEHLSACGDAQAGKNKKIALYCTGGIRCEKASAWLKHNGFKNVKHLKGGIIDYKHQVDREGLENKFKGKNFVFDERMGERIGDEVISYCHLCGAEKSDTHYHCKNQACHVLFLGCDACMKKKKGYCSYKCMTFDRLPEGIKKRLTRNNHKKDLEQFKKNRRRRVQG
ncbi:MAG: rhodanese-related sulfurtransferase [Candidatus Pacebacteria bacterium]|nr:rhodanese-related sulfurtransferase [Candidatus Paceibacterota bacterium]